MFGVDRANLLDGDREVIFKNRDESGRRTLAVCDVGELAARNIVARGDCREGVAGVAPQFARTLTRSPALCAGGGQLLDARGNNWTPPAVDR